MVEALPPATEKGTSTMRVDYGRDELLTPLGRITLEERYCQASEGPQDVFARASAAFSGGDPELAQRLYDYSSKLWFSYATPLISNGGTPNGLPISCFLNYVDDSITGLAANFTENAYLSTNGGGIGTYWGHIRSVGEKTSKGVETPGLMPFLHVMDSQLLAYHQGRTRRGAGAVYIDISHPEIVEFIEMRTPTGGDVHRKNENTHHGVCISDDFMLAVKHGKDWNLVDPNSGITKATVKARDLWSRLLLKRVQTGEPYLFFSDTANRALPEPLRSLGLRVHHSNLCTEVMLPTAADRTAVCCLSSLNMAKYDEWAPVAEQFIDDLITMLDNTLDVFIEQAPEGMWRAVNSAQRERSIGLGSLGWHTFLQQRGLTMEDPEAKRLNLSLYGTISQLAKKASLRLGAERGEAPDMAGTGLRHAHRMAIAPNATSSLICGGVSPSTEPMAANAFAQKTLSGTQEVRNPALQALLRDMGRDKPGVWSSILTHDGSVQHLDWLTPEQKRVFRTHVEHDQMAIMEQAIDRQPFICQGQSFNMALPPNVSPAELNRLHFRAWEGGLKALYYLRSSSVRRTEAVGTNLSRPSSAPAPGESDCTACEA